MPVETNIIIFEVDSSFCTKTLTHHLKEQGILAIAISANQIRFVVHLDITPEMVRRTIGVIGDLVSEKVVVTDSII